MSGQIEIFGRGVDYEKANILLRSATLLVSVLILIVNVIRIARHE